LNRKSKVRLGKFGFGVIHKMRSGEVCCALQGPGIAEGPGNVAYTTTKHAVVGLSKLLRAEAIQMGVRVSVICPGVVRTSILEGGGRYGKMLMDILPERVRQLWEKLKPMPPNLFAKKVLNSVAKNKAVIIVPSWWRVYCGLTDYLLRLG
jgi:short-subunit dehydrogenase